MCNIDKNVMNDWNEHVKKGSVPYILKWEKMYGLEVNMIQIVILWSLSYVFQVRFLCMYCIYELLNICMTVLQIEC